MRYLVLFFLCFPLVSCEDNNAKDVEIKTSLDVPPTILAPFTLRVGTGENAEEVTIDAPWSPISFEFDNKSNAGVTIVAVTFKVTDPIKGTVKSIVLENLSTSLETRPFFTTIRANGDHNCDGVVDKVDEDLPTTDDSYIESGETETVGGISIFKCEFDAGNLALSSNSIQTYIAGMVVSTESESESNQTALESYRGLSFFVEAVFEGWYGTPSNPQSNFFKRIQFTTRSN